jgi:hypothetical protein
MSRCRFGSAVSADPAVPRRGRAVRHARSRSVASCTALAALLATVIAAPAAAGPPPGSGGGDEGGFSCRASALRVSLLGGTVEPLVANPGNAPCMEDSTGLIGPLDLGPVGVSGVLTAQTAVTPAVGHAEAAVTNVAIGALGIPAITLAVLTSSADASCKDGDSVFSSAGEVVNLRIGGTVVQLPTNGDPFTVDLGLAQLYLNRVVTTQNSITRRALQLTVPLLRLDIVIAEAEADVEGKPCGNQPPPPPPECSDKQDNDGDGKIDENDPGCHSGPHGSYNPHDDDERDTPPTKPQCGDGNDNDGDKKIDMKDPQCSNPKDDDESK